MNLPLSDFSRTVELIYDAALDGERWNDAVRAIAHITGSNNSSLHFIDTERNILGNAFHFNTQPEFVRRLLETYGQLWVLQASIFNWPVGEPRHLPDILPTDEFQAGRFYREWIVPQGQGDYVGMIALRSGARMVKSSNARKAIDGPYSREQLDTFKLLAPHVCKAVQISDVLDVRALALSRLDETLSSLRSGVFLVDGQARVVYMNAAADRLQRSHRALTLSAAGYIEPLDPDAARALSAALAAALHSQPATDLADSGTIALPDPRQGGVLAHVLPLRRGARQSVSQHFAAAAALFVQDPHVSVPLPGAAFAKLFGLTPRELQVVVTLLPDRSLPDVSDILGISVATVKTHLASVFAKTGTSRQSELVALVMQSTPPSRSGA